jgi:hypothetical protein
MILDRIIPARREALEKDACRWHGENLLAGFRQAESRPRLISRGFRRWRILSGSWEKTGESRIVHRGTEKVKHGESIAVWGPSIWKEMSFTVTFKFLSNTGKPPEGGAILFFLFRNPRNHCSFHFCLFKKKIQMIRRVRGSWGILDECDCDLDVGREYSATVRSRSGIHACRLDGLDCLQIVDREIPRGALGIGGKYCDVEFSELRWTGRAQLVRQGWERK